eukprot:TRINITY_DN3082_c0_g1_i1.p1 TRINITY_DN3082_c0_g1~~TRINITY_DN3082_c0_g1_i1.p1  ORF type:complete len:610 (-),score=188.55 TRINITY_DN3082_c0_g1_i1:393-2222(-)
MGSLGAYDVGKPIGKGQFSIVYKARNHADGTMMALKKVAMAKMEAKEQDKCLKEVRLLESVQHPSIIRYFEAFIEDEELVIVCEWASGGDLRRVIKKANEQDPPCMFPETEIWRMFEQIVSGVQYMHTQRIMHRDIKPANVLIMGDGKLKLADLGLGRFFSDQTMQAYSKVGTPVYMSPEVLHGKGYDLKSDVWSLGCLLYELATLRTPFKSQGDNLYAIFKKINDCTYERLAEGKFSPELRKVVESILRTDPGTRPHTDDVLQMSQHMCAAAAPSEPVREAPKPAAVSSCVADAERVVEWIKLLSCAPGVRACPVAHLCKHYFCVETAASGVAERFQLFCTCVDWLLEVGGMERPHQIVGVEQSQAATSMIHALQSNQLSSEEWSLPQLKLGWGRQVVAMLLCLAEAAAARTGWQFQQPVRGPEEQADELPEDETEVSGQLLCPEEHAEEASEADGCSLHPDRAPLVSGIDPVHWRAEASRVHSELRAAQKEAGRPGWGQLLPELQRLQGSTAGTAARLQASIRPMIAETEESLVAIYKQEQALQQNLEGPVATYLQAVRDHASAKDGYEELAIVVEGLASSLSEVADRLDGAKVARVLCCGEVCRTS